MLADLTTAKEPGAGDDPAPHAARSFAQPPGPDEAARLLRTLATTPCAFAPVAADRPLALYGAGDLGRLAREFLRTVGLDFALAIDRQAQRIANEPAWSGVPVVAPEDIPASIKRGVRVAVSIVTSPYVPIEQALFEQGFRDVVPFYDLAGRFRHLHPLSNGWFTDPLSAEDVSQTTEVLASWGDDVSRAHHLQFLAWRRLREEWTFDGAPVSLETRFFIPEVCQALRADEILLDAGAYHGAVTRAFVRQTNGAFRGIVAVEPDPSSRARLAQEYQTALPNDPRVTVLDCALAEASGRAPFHAGLGYASQISETGHMEVQTQALDALGLLPTFVKLHLEGFELAALKGMRRTLAASRPIVAATVYHNADGIWRTPLWLMRTLKEYRFLFRLHAWCGTGAVVYAIPNERGAP